MTLTSAGDEPRSRVPTTPTLKVSYQNVLSACMSTDKYTSIFWYLSYAEPLFCHENDNFSDIIVLFLSYKSRKLYRKSFDDKSQIRIQSDARRYDHTNIPYTELMHKRGDFRVSNFPESRFPIDIYSVHETSWIIAESMAQNSNEYEFIWFVLETCITRNIINCIVIVTKEYISSLNKMFCKGFQTNDAIGLVKAFIKLFFILSI